MKKALTLLVCLMMAAASFTFSTTAVSAQEEEAPIFVDAANGSDSNQGTIDQPVQTLAKAQELARQRTAAMVDDLRIYLRGGTYVLDAPLTFTGSDSGQNGYHVIWSNYQDEEVVISGGVSISDWTKADDDKNIWKASAKGLESRDLYVNGTRATLARQDVKALEWAKKYLYVSKENLPDSFARSEDLEIVFARKWKWAILKVASVQENSDFDEPALRLKYTDETKEAFTTNLTGAALDDVQKAEGMRYLQNAYEFLDEPGEFYLNTAEDQVYYIPKEGEDMNSADAVLGKLENLIVFNGTADDVVKNITVTGLNFNYTTFLKANMPDGLHTFQASALINPDDYWDREWIPSTGSAVYGEYIDNINVSGNRFAALGGGGIHLSKGTKNSSITRNEFTKLGSGGILLGDVSTVEHFPSAASLTENNTIADNYVDHVADTYRGAAGILVGYTKGTKVEYNTVKNLPYTGISVGWGWGYGDYSDNKEYLLGENTITHNYIENVLTEPMLIDGGGIYTLGRQDHTVMRDNYVDGVHNEYGGIYLDEGSTGFTITNNVVTNCVRNWLYKGDFNAIYDNYATQAQQPNRDETLPIGDELQYRFENNDMWDEAAVAAIREAAGVRPIPQPEEPTPDIPSVTPTPDDPKQDEPGTTTPETPAQEDIYFLNDTTYDVTVIGKFPSDTKLVVKVLTNDALDEVISLIKDKDFVKQYNLEKVYDIYMLRNGSVYQPNQTIQVAVKLDKELQDKKPRVVYISAEGEITEIASTIKDGNIMFSTDHNSYYAIVTEKAVKNPIADTGAKPTGSGMIAVVLIGGLVYFLTKKMEAFPDEA